MRLIEIDSFKVEGEWITVEIGNAIVMGIKIILIEYSPSNISLKPDSEKKIEIIIKKKVASNQNRPKFSLKTSPSAFYLFRNQSRDLMNESFYLKI